MPPRWKLFIAATAVIAATPGPNMLLVMTTSVRSGFRRSLSTMAGLLTGVVSMIVLSVLGLGAVLQAAPRTFNALRWGGAVYLAYLGLRPWFSRPQEQLARAQAAPRGGHYREGLLVALSNPKALIFAAAFLPQFMSPDLPKGPQLAWLAFFFSVIEVSCYMMYAAGGRRAADLLRRPGVRLAFDRAAGLLFVGFAAALAFA
jgi:threonine/homoserine/homoserine lactone efflux protein